MAAQSDTIENGFKSKNSQDTCDANGLRGFPISLTWKNFNDAREEPNFRFRPQFQGRQVWTYTSKIGSFDDGAFSSSSFYLQGNTYNVKAVHICNSETHTGSSEIQIWGMNEHANYAVINVPIVPASTTSEGLALQKMFEQTEFTSLSDILPQGDHINTYYYTSCNPYVGVDANYKPQTYGSINITTVFFSKPIGLNQEEYARYVSNTVKACGIPINIVQSSWIFNEYTGTDVRQTVKMTKRFDISDQMKSKTVFKKRGFQIPGKAGAKEYKVVEIDPTKIKDPSTFIADLDNSEDIGDFMKKQGENPVIPEIPYDGIKPRNIAVLIGTIIGWIIAFLLLMATWYYGKKLFITEISSPLPTVNISGTTMKEMASIVANEVAKNINQVKTKY